jgi:hypothetical protein
VLRLVWHDSHLLCLTVSNETAHTVVTLRSPHSRHGWVCKTRAHDMLACYVFAFLGCQCRQPFASDETISPTGRNGQSVISFCVHCSRCECSQQGVFVSLTLHFPGSF